jgi:hypothetical protein
MSPGKTFVRCVIAALCGAGHLLALAQGASATFLAGIHGGHVATIVEHDGHQDLMLHHDGNDANDASDADGVGSHAESHAGHGQHHDHLVCLSANQDAAMWENGTRTVPVPAISCEMPVRSWHPSCRRISLSSSGARPPPFAAGGMLGCLRTTVLLV